MKVLHHLKGLHYFLETARYLSIKQAAENLFVTQAAISQQLRLLEETLGVKLFHRHHRSLSLTSEGLILLPQIDLAFKAIEKGVLDLALDPNPNTITLSVMPSFASRWLIPRLGNFYETNPGIAINLSMTEALEEIGGSGPDVAIRFSLGDHQGMESKFLMKDYIYPVCHPSYIEKYKIRSFKSLKKLRLLDDVVTNISWDHWLNKNNEKTDGLKRIRYAGSHYVIDSVLSAQGVAMVRHSLVAEILSQKQLVRLFDSAVELDQHFYLCAPAHHFNYPKIKVFSDWLLNQVNEFNALYALVK